MDASRRYVVKTIPFAKRPEYSIELIVKAFTKEDGSERFKIEVSPTALLADAWSCFIIGAKFALCSQAQATCEEIAKRALLCMD
jgi:DICT domain-containing protein